MRQLSAAGQKVVNDLAQRHRFSSDAVLSMLESIVHGNGNMAQFDHPEFAGAGQWMRGGMTMVSNMFDHSLKSRIDGLCHELAELLAKEPDLISSGSFQSQSQGSQPRGIYGGGQQQQGGSGPVGSASLFVPPAPGSSGNWWPTELGRPNSIGAQNDVRYAYFAPSRRLAIEINGRVTIYDTLDHQISGFSQQQSYGGSLTFSSQHGLVDVASLPVLSIAGVAQHAPGTAASPRQQSSVEGRSAGREVDVIATIEKLAELHGKGILSDEEFATKKAELLGRL
jgi:hypothetical protein